MFEKITEQINKIGIVPVVVIDDACKAAELAKAFMDSGIKTAEITYRTAAAEEAIKRITAEVPGIIVGAGTITTVEMAKSAVAAGAKYLVSPGFNKNVALYCVENNIPIYPGVTSPTEIEAAMEIGLTTLKFFPAEQAGGKKMLSALQSPYGGIKFMPTGGINPDNLNDYLALKNVIACGGSWICPSKLINEGNFDEIKRLCREAVNRMLDFKLLHIGVNSEDEETAAKTANDFAEMFSFPKSENPGGYFVGTAMEVIKKQFLGKHGHIAISTPNVDRARYYFEQRGYKFIEDVGMTIDSEGTVAVYFEKEIGGYAIHLRRA